MKLRLVTYNIHKGVGTDRRLGLERIAEIVNHYSPDVVCMQEVLWRQTADGHKTHPQILAELIGLPHRMIGLNCARPQGVYGNMTLSKFPIVDHENIDLSLTLQKPRGTLYTKLRLPHATLHVFNVHLGLAGWERLLQMRDLVEETPHVAIGDEPVVFAGDMNDWRHRLFPSVMCRSGFRCAVGDADDPGHATFPSRLPVAALDKVFFCGAVKTAHAYPSRLALARVASDHLPLVAELEIAPR